MSNITLLESKSQAQFSKLTDSFERIELDLERRYMNNITSI